MRSACAKKKIQYSGSYSIPDKFSTKWILYQVSGKDPIAENYIKENYTTLQVMETLLMRQIEALKQIE